MVYGDFYVVKVVKEGVVGKDFKIFVVIILMLLDCQDLDGVLIKDGEICDLVKECVGKVFEVGVDGVIVSL